VIERQVMKPYRTEQEALSVLQGEANYLDYNEVLEFIPHEGVRRLIDLRLDKRYKKLKFKNEFDVIRHIDWVETPEGSSFWVKVFGWTIGLNDLPELA
jgi:hypothetical protein